MRKLVKFLLIGSSVACAAWALWANSLYNQMQRQLVFVASELAIVRNEAEKFALRSADLLQQLEIAEAELQNVRSQIAFATAKFILANEGGFSNHPDDPGGPTAFGFSSRYSKQLPRSYDQALLFVYDFIHENQLAELAPSLQRTIADAFFWLGAPRVKAWLASLFNTTNWNDTLSALLAIPEAEADGVIRFLQDAATAEVNRLVSNNPSLATFQKGWLRRISRWSF